MSWTAFGLACSSLGGAIVGGWLVAQVPSSTVSEALRERTETRTYVVEPGSISPSAHPVRGGAQPRVEPAPHVEPAPRVEGTVDEEVEELPPEEYLASLRAQYSETLASHANETVDPEWSPGAVERLTRDLSEGSEGRHFALRSVDCRTHTCVAETEWSDHATARAHFGEVLHAVTQDGCAVEVVLHESAYEDDVYTLPVVYHCR
jgi:hypothetical protein